ncbi:hypothetical protein JR316_0011545 [Psilocybe cubensis]|uniref:Uncharacterized protein n=1 Tax=Psilocybe cubensis TaxID=181762 RepID=A0ACB8GKJ2_PSICU|nr:hypothetical protein JR316_0011545 [Psilocybe cubensis]KAH9475980.1 hypothetical protein JR316_0011545 [Psilocybe cubensis]
MGNPIASTFGVWLTIIWLQALLRISSFKDLSSTKPVSTLQAAAALLCDIVITAALVVTLANRKGTIKTPPVYMNSALATLNSRQHTIKRSRVPVTTGDSSTRDWNSIPMGAISTGTGYTGTLQDPEHESHVHVLVSKQTIADNDPVITLPEEYKDTPNFVDGMV